MSATPRRSCSGEPNRTASWRRSCAIFLHADGRWTWHVARAEMQSGCAKLGWVVTAVDYSEVALERARRLAAGQHVDVEWVQADVTSFAPAADCVPARDRRLPAGCRKLRGAPCWHTRRRRWVVGGILFMVDTRVSISPKAWAGRGSRRCYGSRLESPRGHRARPHGAARRARAPSGRAAEEVEDAIGAVLRAGARDPHPRRTRGTGRRTGTAFSSVSTQPMFAYIIRRLLLLIIPTLFGIMLLNFIIVQAAPGGPSISSSRASRGLP